MEKTKHKIELLFPDVEVVLLPRQSRGDQLQNIPLQTVEGSDFFTQDIFDALKNNEADIAVHSLKDMSGTHFFGDNKFAIVERDDARDVAIFNKNVEGKIREGKEIIIGTCSPRREEMAIGFLQKALPQHSNFSITTKVIRGNVDTRLQKLDAGEYDGIILATAGINRLLQSESSKQLAYKPEPVKGDKTLQQLSIKQLLLDKKLMLLPLIECVPAPCQGAIVAEAHHTNAFAVKVIECINNKQLMDECKQEKKIAMQFGTGCLQKFGVTSIQYDTDKTIVYAAGTNEDGKSFTEWQGLPTVQNTTSLFSSTDYMGNFFSYQYYEEVKPILNDVVYVANYKAVNNSFLINQLQAKNIWAAGTKTWYQLAKQNIWVTGCADAFGLAFLNEAWQMPLLNIDWQKTTILTSEQGAELWENKGWQAIASYTILPKKDIEVEEKIKQANIVFWTSFQQYQQYKSALKKEVIHCCSSGETATLLRDEKIEPIVFPNIKSFLQWKK